MKRKLRTLLAAMLLVPMLISNASAFTTDGENALNPARPRGEWCEITWNGFVFVWWC